MTTYLNLSQAFIKLAALGHPGQHMTSGEVIYVNVAAFQDLSEQTV